jgi:hypothetical protein
MEFHGDHAHAFIVRFWLEPGKIQGEKPRWRGLIEHVPTGRQLSLRGLDEITAFIGYYLPGINELN